MVPVMLLREQVWDTDWWLLYYAVGGMNMIYSFQSVHRGHLMNMNPLVEEIVY